MNNKYDYRFQASYEYNFLAKDHVEEENLFYLLKNFHVINWMKEDKTLKIIDKIAFIHNKEKNRLVLESKALEKLTSWK
jgi:hypothetical protein